MYCSKCGNQIADGSRFCNFCGAPVPAVESFVEKVEEPAPAPAAPEPPAEPEPVRRPFIEEINWNVNEYPDTDTIEKTDDIDFDWSADPAEIRERLTKGYPESVKAEINEKADALNVEDLIPSRPEPEVFAEPASEEISATDKIDKFYTFSRKNEEFQQLLNREYDKIKGGNPIEKEKEIAEKTAQERFEARTEDPSMEAFLDREGVNKPYEPKAFESDVLERIEAHERAIEQARAEEEARRRMIEEERAKAAEAMRAAEEARIRAEEEERERMARQARELAEAEVRRAEEAARLAAAEAAAAEEEATRLEAEAAAKLAAEQEARKAEEEAERRAEEKEEEAARKKALEEEQEVLAGDFILSESNIRYYSEEALNKLTDREVLFALNEIYARRGRIFTGEEFRRYFESKDWYKGTIPAEEFDANQNERFNEYEKANINALVKIAQERGIR